MKGQRDNEKRPAGSLRCKGSKVRQITLCVLPKAVDNVLSFPKVDFIQRGANLVLHILTAE